MRKELQENRVRDHNKTPIVDHRSLEDIQDAQLDKECIKSQKPTLISILIKVFTGKIT